MDAILALDQGTTSSRALLVNSQGEILFSKQKEFPQIFPKPGWVEHDPEVIWSSQNEVANEVLKQVDFKPKGIGITNQRETTILWDRETGKPIYNAIVWQDRRTVQDCKELRKKGFENLIKKKTGLLLDPYFSATKVRWILNNVEGASEKAKKGLLAFGTIDSWLVWKLTEGKMHITDASNASRTLLFNIHKNCWDDELLEIFDIPKSILPEVRDSSEIYGDSIYHIPIAGIAGDQQAALFGQACFTPGMGKITYGTGCFILIQTGSEAGSYHKHLITTVASRINGKLQYALEGSVFIGGAVVQWLRDNLQIISKSSEIESLANEVDSTEGVYFVPALSGLGAPHWNPNARGTIVGLTRSSTKAHLARAALEGIVLQVDDILEVLQFPITEIRVDGGASRNDMMMQMQADMQSIPIVRCTKHEVTALGAAYLAGLATGVYKDLEHISSLWKAQKTFTPMQNKEWAKEKKDQWNRAIQCAGIWNEST